MPELTIGQSSLNSTLQITEKHPTSLCKHGQVLQKLYNMCVSFARERGHNGKKMKRSELTGAGLKEHTGVRSRQTREKIRRRCMVSSLLVRKIGQTGHCRSLQTPEDGSNATLRMPTAVGPQRRRRGLWRNLRWVVVVLYGTILRKLHDGSCGENTCADAW